MNRILPLLLVFFIIGCSEQKTNDNDLSGSNLKGEILVIETSYFSSQIDTITGLYQLSSKEIATYNAIGNLIEEKSYNNKNVLNRTISNTYNLDEIIDEQIISINNVFYSRSEFHYNELKKITEKLTYDEEGNLTQKVIYKYNKQGFNIEQSNYNNQDNLIGKSDFIHNQNGRPTKWRMYDTEGNITIKTNSEYNKYGDIIAETFHSIGNSPSVNYSFIYDYDCIHNWTSKKWFIGDSLCFINQRKITYKE